MTNKQKPKKQTNRKSVIATRRSTGGTGFDFEDCVAAWLILQALTERPLPISGQPKRLQMQTAPMHWDIDDILLTMEGQAGDKRLAVSCKGNVQVSANGLPSSFAKEAWKLWTKPNSPLNRTTDMMALATQGTHAEFQKTWSEVKRIASGVELTLAKAQIVGNRRYKRVFEALEAAADTAIEDSDVLALIRSLEVLPFDFQQVQSKDEKDAVNAARSLLADASMEDAKKLWSSIVDHARKTRLGSGTLDFGKLLRFLRSNFSLKDFPNYETSWHRLRAFSAEVESAIETTLPTGVALDFASENESLLKQLQTNPCIIVYGESGTGKSALVKTFLKMHFPKVTRVSLAAEILEQALNEAERVRLGIMHPLLRLLEAAVTSENFLIIDAAERLTPSGRIKVRELVKQLLALDETETTPLWRIIIVGQTEFWASGELQKIAGTPQPPHQEVPLRPNGEVASVLRASPGLEWLASQGDTLQALTNPRTLAWVIQAAPVFHDGNAAVPTSLVAIAEKIWSHWTKDQVALQGFLMRLAIRDAAFEHSVPVSTLDPADAKAFDERPQQCPVKRNTTNNHIQFKHDLAADWVRFQHLKEIATDTAKWAAHAANPLWTGALRMLGQFLLRQPSGSRTAWDDAFDAVQVAPESSPLADDILLDALFLDPTALVFLEERSELLFANNGRHLQRLLMRFEHIATVSDVIPSNAGWAKGFETLFETKFRTPTFGRWPALVVFLDRHQERVASLLLPQVSQLCERWLTTMPLTLKDGTPFPCRLELAKLALATARALQLSIAKNDIWASVKRDFFQAAFAGAHDIPDEVGAWALEMAQRNPMRADIAERLRAHRRDKAAEHRCELENNAEYRERHKRKRSISAIPSSRRLPPWALGPREPVDNRFAEIVQSSVTFHCLMKVRPAIAAEVLLAVFIEGDPKEDFNSCRGFHEELGLTFDHEGYPTAYWKSPLYYFLSIDAPIALATILKLVSFCTDRWEQEITRHQGSEPPSLSVRLIDGAERHYRGYYHAFAWSQANDFASSQLHSALAALEKWLCKSKGHGASITGFIDYLIRHSDSVAVLGVLVSVGKCLPELFRTEIKPLLALAQIYEWDEGRVTNSGYNFDGSSWIRDGEIVFELAREWHAEPYRHHSLTEIVSELCRQDHDLGDFVNAAVKLWALPDSDKERIEFQARAAQLDYRNYLVSHSKETGEEQVQFEYPADLATAITSFQENMHRVRDILAFPDNCRRFVAAPAALPLDQITAIAALMAAADGDEVIELDEEMIRPARVATAVVLLLGGKEWLAANSDVRDRAHAIVATAVKDIALEIGHSHLRYAIAPSYLVFVAHFVFQEWLMTPSAATDHALMQVLTSGDDIATGVIIKMAYVRRSDLGDRWWRLLYLVLLWSGLTIIKPRAGHQEEVGERRWLRWVQWFQTRPVSGQSCTLNHLHPLELAKRVEEFEARKWEEEYRLQGRSFTRDRTRRMSGALDTRFLEIAFAWLLTDEDLPIDPAEREQRRYLLKEFWAHQVWYLTGSEREGRDDYAPMGQFCYKLLGEIATMTLMTDVNTAPALWQPVFDLGPKGHFALGHFFQRFFYNLNETTDTNTFAAHWRPMIEAVMEGRGWESGSFHHQQSLERQVLGFANSDALVRPSKDRFLVKSMEDLYRTWAEKRLLGDEDNLAAFCNFLSTQAGMPLRLEALVWIANAISSRRSWYRAETSSAFMGFLSTIITEDGVTAVARPETRQAMIALTGLAASRQLPTALTVQDRLKKLL